MRISDWSSDVCSSDLIAEPRQIEQHRVRSSRRQRLEVGCSFAERAGDGVTARESRFRPRAAQPTRNARNQPSTAHSGHPSKTSPPSFWIIVAASIRPYTSALPIPSRGYDLVTPHALQSQQLSSSEPQRHGQGRLEYVKLP